MAGLYTVIEIMLLLAGFVLAAEIVAEGTHRLEPLLGQGMAGGVLLGLMGSLPETIFVVIAVLNGSFNVAVGTAIGGNIILFTLGIGLAIVIYALKWKKSLKMKEDYHIELYFFAASTIGIGLLILYGSLDILSGLALSAVYVLYVLYRYKQTSVYIKNKNITKEGTKLLLKGALYIVIGAILVILLSRPFIESISSLATDLRIPLILAALVISPIAADFGENLSAYRVVMKSPSGGSTAIVSFLGGKLENNTILLGLIGIIASIMYGAPVSIKSSIPELLTVIGVNVVALAFITRGRFGYKEGIILVALYFIGIAAAFVL